jgi:Skp family chaperone for outer membrane proteins
MTSFTRFMGAGLLAGGALIALPAAAQVSSVAVIDPASAILSAKALGVAIGTIGTTYKTQFDQLNARQTALAAELKTMAAPLDTNKDGQVSQAEVEAATTAKNPLVERLRTAQGKNENELGRLNQPMVRAEVFAIEQIMGSYSNALQTVITTKKVQLLLNADAVIYGLPAADITPDVKNEIDRILPTVSIAPAETWQPSQQAVQLFQQYQQAQQAAAQRAAIQPAGAVPAAAPAAAPAVTPAVTPAAGPATKP